jgi:hypothetical protein
MVLGKLKERWEANDKDEEHNNNDSTENALVLSTDNSDVDKGLEVD